MFEGLLCNYIYIFNIFKLCSDNGLVLNRQEIRELQRINNELLRENEVLRGDIANRENILNNVINAMPVEVVINENNISVDNIEQNLNPIEIRTNVIEGLNGFIGFDRLTVGLVNLNNVKVLNNYEIEINENNVGGEIRGQEFEVGNNVNGVVGVKNVNVVVDVEQNPNIVENVDVNVLQNNINDMRQEIERLQRDILKKDVFIEELRGENDENLIIINENRNERAALTARIMELNESINQVNVNNTELINQVNRLTNQNNEKDIKISKLEEDIKGKSELSDLERENFNERIDTLVTTNAELMNQRLDAVEKFNKLRSVLPLYIKLERSDILENEIVNTNKLNLNGLLNLNLNNLANVNMDKEHSSDDQIIKPIRKVYNVGTPENQDIMYLYNLSFDNVLVKEKLEIPDELIFNDRLGRIDIDISNNSQYVGTKEVKINLDSFNNEWYCTDMIVESKMFKMLYDNDSRINQILQIEYDNDNIANINREDLKDENKVKYKVFRLYNNLNNNDFKEIDNEYIRLSVKETKLVDMFGVIDNQGEVIRVENLNELSGYIGNLNGSERLVMFRNRKCKRVPVHYYYNVYTKKIMMIFLKYSNFENELEESIFKILNKNDYYYIGSEYYMEIYVEDIYEFEEGSINGDLISRNRVDKIEIKNIVFYLRNRLNELLEVHNNIIGFDFTKILEILINNGNLEVDGRLMKIDNLSVISDYDKNKNNVYYLEFNIKNNNEGTGCNYELFSKYRPSFDDRNVSTVEMEFEEFIKLKYVNDSLNEVTVDISKDYDKLYLKEYGELPVDEVRIEVKIEKIRDLNSLNVNDYVFTFDIPYVLVYDILFDRILFLTVKPNQEIMEGLSSNINEFGESEYVISFNVEGGINRGLYVISKGYIASLQLYYDGDSNNLVSVSKALRCLNLKFSNGAGKAVRKFKFDLINYNSVEDVYKYADLENIEKFKKNVKHLIKPDVVAKEFINIENEEKLYGLFNFDNMNSSVRDIVNGGSLLMKSYNFNRNIMNIGNVFDYRGIEFLSKETVKNIYINGVKANHMNWTEEEMLNFERSNELLEYMMFNNEDLYLNTTNNNNRITYEYSDIIVPFNNNNINSDSLGFYN